MLHAKTFTIFLKLFNPFVRKNIFIGDHAFWSPLIYFYLSKSIKPEAKAEFNRQVYILFERGYKLKMARELEKIADLEFPPGTKRIFRNSRDYIKYHTMISDVKLNDFSFVYLFYAFWALTLLIFTLHCNILRLRRAFRTCKRHLKMLITSMRRGYNKILIRLHMIRDADRYIESSVYLAPFGKESRIDPNTNQTETKRNRNRIHSKPIPNPHRYSYQYSYRYSYRYSFQYSYRYAFRTDSSDINGKMAWFCLSKNGEYFAVLVTFFPRLFYY